MATTVNSDQVRIPREVRDAVDRGESVIVLNRDRPVLAIVPPETVTAPPPPNRRGIAVRELVAALRGGPAADPGFAADMDAVRASIGPTPEDPWERS